MTDERDPMGGPGDTGVTPEAEVSPDAEAKPEAEVEATPEPEATEPEATPEPEATFQAGSALPVSGPVDGGETTEALPEPPPPPPAMTDLVRERERRGPFERLEGADRRVLVLGAISVVLGVATVLLALMVFAPQIAPLKLGATRLAAEATESREVVALAERFAANFLTIDHRTIDADFDRLTADATGSFKDQLQRVLEVTRTQFREREASSKGEVSDSLMLSNREGTAVVRVVVERTITNASTDGTQAGAQVLDVTLVETTAGWKVDNMQQLQGPSEAAEEG